MITSWDGNAFCLTGPLCGSPGPVIRSFHLSLLLSPFLTPLPHPPQKGAISLIQDVMAHVWLPLMVLLTDDRYLGPLFNWELPSRCYEWHRTCVIVNTLSKHTQHVPRFRTNSFMSSCVITFIQNITNTYLYLSNHQAFDVKNRILKW